MSSPNRSRLVADPGVVCLSDLFRVSLNPLFFGIGREDTFPPFASCSKSGSSRLATSGGANYENLGGLHD